MSALPSDPGPSRDLPTDDEPAYRPDVLALMHALIERGHWRRLEPLMARGGPTGAAVRAYIVAELGTRACEDCGRAYVSTDRRVRYCSDRCRHHATDNGRVVPRPLLPVARCGICGHALTGKRHRWCAGCHGRIRGYYQAALARHRPERGCMVCGMPLGYRQYYYCSQDCAKVGIRAGMRAAAEVLRQRAGASDGAAS